MEEHEPAAVELLARAGGRRGPARRGREPSRWSPKSSQSRSPSSPRSCRRPSPSRWWPRRARAERSRRAVEPEPMPPRPRSSRSRSLRHDAHSADQRHDPSLPDPAGATPRRRANRPRGGRRRTAPSWPPVALSSTAWASEDRTRAAAAGRDRRRCPIGREARPSARRTSRAWPRLAAFILGGVGAERSPAREPRSACRAAASAGCRSRRTLASAADAGRARPSRPSRIRPGSPRSPCPTSRIGRTSRTSPDFSDFVVPGVASDAVEAAAFSDPLSELEVLRGSRAVEARSLEDDAGREEHPPQDATAALADGRPVLEHRVDDLGHVAAGAALIVIRRHGARMMS